MAIATIGDRGNRGDVHARDRPAQPWPSRGAPFPVQIPRPLPCRSDRSLARLHMAGISGPALSRKHLRILVALHEAAAGGGATATQLVDRTGYSRAAVSTGAEPRESARAGLPGVARPQASSVSTPAVSMMDRREKVFGPGRRMARHGDDRRITPSCSTPAR
jgi:hypothetical protein